MCLSRAVGFSFFIYYYFIYYYFLHSLLFTGNDIVTHISEYCKKNSLLLLPGLEPVGTGLARLHPVPFLG